MTLATKTSTYYPFGMPMPNRTFSYQSGSSYRFGFNGQSKDNEVYGFGNLNTAMFWEYDTRLGRRWNVDPVRKESESSFSCFSENPINVSDVKGDDGKSAAAVVVLTQEVSASAAATGVLLPAVPFIEVIGAALALWELTQDFPVVIPTTPPVQQNQQPILHKTESKEVEIKPDEKEPSTKNASSSNQNSNRQKNRLNEKGEPNSMKTNEPNTTTKKYGEDGWTQKEYNNGHQNHEGVGAEDHVHDYKPNPNHPQGRPTRMPARKPKPNELLKDKFKINEQERTGNNK